MTTLAQNIRARTRKDFIVGRTVTFFGCSVLVTFLVLIGHLVWQTLPILTSPKMMIDESLSIKKIGLVSAADYSNGGLLISQAAQCGYVFSSQNIPDSGYLQPCNHQLNVTEDKGVRWLFDVSPYGQVRVSSVDGESKKFAFSIPEDFWQQTRQFEIALAMPHIAILLTSDDNHHILWYDVNDLTHYQHNQLSSKLDVRLLPELNAYIHFKDDGFYFVSKHQTPETHHIYKENIKNIISLENNRSLFVIGKNNSVERWVIQNENGAFKYLPTYHMQLDVNEWPLKAISHASSNAGLLLTNRNRLILFNRITGEQFQTIQLAEKPKNLRWLGQVVYVAFENEMKAISVSNIAGIITFSSLFQPQWYEGYTNLEHIYQTTSGSDFQEAKYSLVPLLIGSIKAASVALVVALPLGLGAAVYCGFFAKQSTRNKIKPTIEMLEAVPSVVIGFIAAVSIAPLAEELLFSLLIFLITSPIVLLTLALFQHKLIALLPKPQRLTGEMVLSAVVILSWGLAVLVVANQLVPYTHFEDLSKTTVIVCIALGIAISPTVFTLAEDAIDSVPNQIKSASFALGATRLQTLKNVVLRIAMPGLIAAIMLGFGRAFGETMIVLMVTGNTPIPSWDLFESLRALTANIAIELPEAESGSALYSVLFFTALALFVFTFVINSMAEWLRYRMREKVKYD